MQDSSPIDHVVIHGVGLIGGSIAAALRQRIPDCRVTGVGRSERRLEAAGATGLLDDWSQSMDRVEFGESAVVVVCLPVSLIASSVISTAALVPDSVLITDAGSTKREIQDEIGRDPVAAARYVGAHPIAGSEQTGFEHADARLFHDRPCIVISPSSVDPQMERCCAFWRAVGARVSVMDAGEHDRVLAVTSHLPHVMAAITALGVKPAELEFSGSGFADTTRVAAGDPGLWRQILCQNRANVLAGLSDAGKRLNELADALRRGDDVEVESLLHAAAAIRGKLS